MAHASREQRWEQREGVSGAQLESLDVIETGRRWKGIEFWQVEHPGSFTNPILRRVRRGFWFVWSLWHNAPRFP